LFKIGCPVSGDTHCMRIEPGSADDQGNQRLSAIIRDQSPNQCHQMISQTEDAVRPPLS